MQHPHDVIFVHQTVRGEVAEASEECCPLCGRGFGLN
ncbi:hypothetical protein FAF44_46290 [Nonomuraea sp. MG754425]|nr:hypothetical protein [Nonomuraea sp. MG754425]